MTGVSRSRKCLDLKSIFREKSAGLRQKNRDKLAGNTFFRAKGFMADSYSAKFCNSLAKHVFGWHKQQRRVIRPALLMGDLFKLLPDTSGESFFFFHLMVSPLVKRALKRLLSFPSIWLMLFSPPLLLLQISSPSRNSVPRPFSFFAIYL